MTHKADKLLPSEAPEQPLMEECYLNVMVEYPKPPRTGREIIHNYAELPDLDVCCGPEAADSAHTPPPSPPPYEPPGGGGGGERLRPEKSPSSRGRARAGRSCRSLPDYTAPPPPALKLPAGRLIEYLANVRAKQQQIHQLLTTYNSLVEKVQFRNVHPDWSEKIPEPAPGAPLLTLRDTRSEREPPVVPLDSITDDALLPLSPNDAWEAVAALRQQMLELQVTLMYSRIQVKYRELRLQEVTAEHRRFKASVRDQQRRAEKQEQSRELRIRQLERRCSLTSTHCSQWRLKTRQAEKSGNKKKRRSELLAKGLEQIFTPMQLRVIRTGKKPRWTEEDIRRAIELKKLVTRRGYAFIRNNMKIPLPSPMIMRRGALRFAALKPLYEQMVAANLLKYSTKKKLKTKKEGRLLEDQEHELRTDAVEKEPLVAETATEPVRQAPVKRRRKRPPPPAPPPSFEVKFEDMGDVERTLAADAAAAATAAAVAGGTPKRACTTWPPSRPSWECGRLWDGHAPEPDEYVAPSGGERQSRHRPTWSADTADFL